MFCVVLGFGVLFGVCCLLSCGLCVLFVVRCLLVVGCGLLFGCPYSFCSCVLLFDVCHSLLCCRSLFVFVVCCFGAYRLLVVGSLFGVVVSIRSFWLVAVCCCRVFLLFVC